MTKSTNPEDALLPVLPADFLPGDQDVVIGKGKKFYFHTGNQWLRTLVSTMLDEYKQAQTKSDKSNIISDVVEYVRKNGRFVRRDVKSGQWMYAEPLLCREKCSQSFRDNMADTYRSSNVAKRNKRRQEQEEKRGGGGSKGKMDSMIAMPEAKRMRSTPGPTGTNTAAPNIPTQLFDLNMEMPSLQSQVVQQQQSQAPVPAQNNFFQNGGLDLTGIDLNALTNLLNGNASNHHQQNNNDLSGFGAGQMNTTYHNNGPSAQAVRRASLSLMSALPELFSGQQEQQQSVDVEPTPLRHHNANNVSAVQNMAASLYESLFQSNNNNNAQQQQDMHHHQQQAKRHSLAFADSDWFKLPSDDHATSTTPSAATSNSVPTEKVNAAFAA